MKQKILEILKRELQIVQSGYMNGYADLEGTDDAAEAIAQEVCNAQAKGWWDSWIPDHKDEPDHRDELTLLEYLIENNFNTEQAEIAIDQLKNKEA